MEKYNFVALKCYYEFVTECCSHVTVECWSDSNNMFKPITLDG